MNQKSIDGFFQGIEQRYADGKISPLSTEGVSVHADLLRSIEWLHAKAAELELPARRPDDDSGAAMDEFLQVVYLRTRLILLLGKWTGFADGTRNLLARCGQEREHFM